MNLKGIALGFVWSCSIGTLPPSNAEELSSIATRGVVEEKPDLCQSFANKAAESKLLRNKQELLELKSKIEEQLVKLEEKTKQLQDLTAKRDEYRAAVSASLVKIYTNVEPEIAAQQLEKLSVEMASEVLQRLSPKISGEIVTAMDVKLASRIVKLMLANSAKLNEKTEKP
jgi:flagellar motility protein MotE (MotC chaperone)